MCGIVPSVRRQPPHWRFHSHEGSPRPQGFATNNSHNKQTFVKLVWSFFTMHPKIKNAFIYDLGFFIFLIINNLGIVTTLLLDRCIFLFIVLLQTKKGKNTMKKEIFYVTHFTGEILHLLVINSKDFRKVVRKYKKLGCNLEPAPSYLMYENDTYFTIVEE